MAESIIEQRQPDWVLVWTNTSPSATFGAQTVAVDLSSYSWSRIEIKFSIGDTTHCNYFTMPVESSSYSNKKQVSILTSTFYSGSSGAPYVFTRDVNATSTGVTFSACYRKTLAGTTAGSTVTDRSIPLRIWAQE